MSEKDKKSKIEPRVLKGFRDFLPKEQIARQKMVENIRKSYELFGFSPIETPTLEYSDILTGKYGDEGDKLMYRFKDNGDRDVALRYDLTIPLARVVAQYGDIKKPFKRYQIANVFRADNPQKGRYREFCQCDADIVGSDSIAADAEILALAGFVLENLGVKDFEIRVNDRRLLDEYIKSEEFEENKKFSIIRTIDKFDKIGEEAVRKELKEIGFGNDKNIDQLIRFIKIRDFKNINNVEFSTNLLVNLEKYGKEIQNVVEIAKKLNPNLSIVIDFTIVRGLDYYTGMVFETKLLKAPEYGSVLSGGRYDNLIGTFANKSIPAVGMSVGVDRLFAALAELKLVPEVKTVTKVLAPNVQIAAMLRQVGINTETLYDSPDFDKMRKYAESREIPFMIVVDPSEANENKVKLIEMKTGNKKIDTLENIIKQIK